jgi:hypothetical protein
MVRGLGPTKVDCWDSGWSMGLSPPSNHTITVCTICPPWHAYPRAGGWPRSLCRNRQDLPGRGRLIFRRDLQRMLPAGQRAIAPARVGPARRKANGCASSPCSPVPPLALNRRMTSDCLSRVSHLARCTSEPGRRGLPVVSGSDPEALPAHLLFTMIAKPHPPAFPFPSTLAPSPSAGPIVHRSLCAVPTTSPPSRKGFHLPVIRHLLSSCSSPDLPCSPHWPAIS